MKLMTKELEKEFEKYPLYSQDGKSLNAKVIVKYFDPFYGGRWFITEGNKLDNGDYYMFGYCYLGDSECAEFGYVLLSQLENITFSNSKQSRIERDLHLKKNTTVRQALKDCCIKLPSYWDEEEME